MSNNEYKISVIRFPGLHKEATYRFNEPDITVATVVFLSKSVGFNAFSPSSHRFERRD